ncbi:MAG TPA: hypothetical protein DD379_01785 [Cyanobacteria bacterium UBA11162]|nr:hypothetical protein [Cyanobacteria bacterium UBA11162]
MGDLLDIIGLAGDDMTANGYQAIYKAQVASLSTCTGMKNELRLRRNAIASILTLLTSPSHHEQF